MTLQRVITEFGTGNDLHGGDYTKAAVRAVEDAIHHSSLSLIRSLGLDARTMQVEVTIGVQRPAEVRAETVYQWAKEMAELSREDQGYLADSEDVAKGRWGD